MPAAWPTKRCSWKRFNNSAGSNGTTSTTGAEDQYSVRLSGMTNNTSTLAQLMARLGAPDSKMPVSVMLERSMRENVLDGQVVRFQVTCEKNKGAANSAG